MVSPQASPIDLSFRAFLDDRRPGDLGRVFELAAPELLGIGRCMRLDEELAQDALQETFLVVLRRMRDYDREREFLPWATGIYVRTAQSVRRRRHARVPHSSDLHRRVVEQPDQVLEARELMDAVQAATEQLPQTYRDIIRATLQEGAGPKELAERHGITPNAAAVRVHRGMKALRQSLGPAVVATLFSQRASAQAVEAVRPRILARARRMRWLGAPQVAVGALALLGGATLVTVSLGADDGGDEALSVLNETPARMETPVTLDAVATITREDPEPLIPTWRAQLVDADGAAVPSGVEVFLLATDDLGGLVPPDAPPVAIATTDQQGSLDIRADLLAGDHVPLLFARHDGRVAWSRLTDLAEGDELRLELRGAGELDVELTDPEGAPIAGARVTVVPVFLPFAPFPTPLTAKRGYIRTDGYTHLFHAETDASGRARVGPIPIQEVPTPFYIRVGAPGFASHLEISGLDAPGVAVLLTQLVRERGLEGRIVDESGAPIPGARVTADWRGDAPLNAALTTAGAGGDFRIEPSLLTSFPVRLRFAAPGHGDATVSFDAPQELPAEPLQVQLDSVEPLTGVVVDELGDPVTGAIVRFANADDVHETESGDGGLFELNGLRPGPGEVWAEPPAPNPKRLRPAGRVAISEQSPALRLVLPSRPAEPASARVTVLDAQSGALLRPARASLHAGATPADDSVNRFTGPWPDDSVQLNDSGVHLTQLSAGSWTLFVDGGAGRMGYIELDLVAGEEQATELRLGQGATLECRLPPRDTPWRFFNANLSLEVRAPGWFDLGDGVLRRFFKTSLPGEHTTLTNLIPGKWYVSAATSTDFAEDVAVVLRPGETHSLELPVEPAGILEVEYDAPETPVRIVLDIRMPGDSDWRERMDKIVDPQDPIVARVPVPLGTVRWRARYLHFLPRVTEAEVFLRQEGEAEVSRANKGRAYLSFERMR